MVLCHTFPVANSLSIREKEDIKKSYLEKNKK